MHKDKSSYTSHLEEAGTWYAKSLSKKISKNSWIFIKKTWHSSHILKLVDKMCKYKMDPASIVAVTERARFGLQTDGRTKWNQYTPQLRRQACSQHFNDYFCNIASRIGFDIPITSVWKIRDIYSTEADSFNFSCVNGDVITSKLRSIKINKGPGYDCSLSELIRLAHEVLSSHFTYMLNPCITRSVFPSIMKNAERSPFYMREDQLN